MPYGLDCNNCPRDHKCDVWGDKGLSYKHEGTDIMGLEWKKCPSSYLDNSHLLVALDLLQCTKVSPLHNWPMGWSAWVVKYTTGIKNAIEDRKAHEVQVGDR